MEMEFASRVAGKAWGTERPSWRPVLMRWTAPTRQHLGDKVVVSLTRCECPELAVCHEYRRSKRRCATVREMKEGPSGSVVRD